MTCTVACVRPTPAQCHCATCHRTFGGITGFDRHRRTGQCLDPAELTMVDRGGVWREPMSEALAAKFRQLRGTTP